MLLVPSDLPAKIYSVHFYERASFNNNEMKKRLFHQKIDIFGLIMGLSGI